MTDKHIGFIGLGIMGQPMATHLINAGYDLTVYDLFLARTEPLVALGARAAGSCRELAAVSDVVITMVPDSPDAEAAYLGENGVLAGVRADTLLIDMSTISPVTAMDIAKQAAKLGCPMLDAPVSGGDVGAKNATLSIMVGGDAAAFDRARPILERMGTPTLCGQSGAGQTVKACNQIQVALNYLGMSEALVLGAKAGVDPAVIIQVLSKGLAQSRVMDQRGQRVIHGDFAPGFRSRFHYKDLHIILETARAFGCSLPGTALAFELFAAMQANDMGDLDHSALIRIIEMLSHTEARSQG